jgi:hypothetical protein
MNYDDVIADVLDDAAKIIPPGKRIDIVTRIRRDFAKLGHCDVTLITKIEELIRMRLDKCSVEEKQSIWESLKAGGATIGEDDHFEDYDEGCADMTLEAELLSFITEELSPLSKKRARDIDEDEDRA